MIKSLIKSKPIKEYSPRLSGEKGGGEIEVKYSANDELSPIIKTVRCDLYDTDNNFVTTIATADSLTKGENFFLWDGRNGGTEIVKDGAYKVRIKAFDLAGNFFTTQEPLVIDSTPPLVSTVAITPNPVSSKDNELKLKGSVNEESSISIKLTNTSTKKVTAYLSTSNLKSPSGDLGAQTFSQVWKFGESFGEDLEDGSYRVELSAIDESGNTSITTTLESVIIDRTPPEISSVSAYPYVLANSGANAYKTTLTYKITDSRRDSAIPPADNITVKIKLYNSNTGVLVKTWDNAPNATDEVNQITWNATSTDYPKGAYRFQIIVEDSLGNQGIAYASCVKDGISPVISYPAEDNTEVSGIIAIRGTAVDPDWTNNKPFKQYTVSIVPLHSHGEGEPSIPSMVGEAAIEVPAINRTSSTPKNISLRPVQNNSTLAYLNTNMLANGEYTVNVRYSIYSPVG